MEKFEHFLQWEGQEDCTVKVNCYGCKYIGKREARRIARNELQVESLQIFIMNLIRFDLEVKAMGISLIRKSVRDSFRTNASLKIFLENKRIFATGWGVLS